MKNKIKHIILTVFTISYMLWVMSVQCMASDEKGTKIPDSKARDRAEPAFIELSDGEYAIPVVLEGGSGKSSVTSPAPMSVKDGKATITLVWSSENYDYMISGGEKYNNVNDDGYSTFEIPITDFDKPMTVIADTTAMSVPHEIEYTMKLSPDEIMDSDETPQAAAKRVVYMALGIICFCAAVSIIKKKRQ